MAASQWPSLWPCNAPPMRDIAQRRRGDSKATKKEEGGLTASVSLLCVASSIERRRGRCRRLVWDARADKETQSRHGVVWAPAPGSWPSLADSARTERRAAVRRHRRKSSAPAQRTNQERAEKTATTHKSLGFSARDDDDCDKRNTQVRWWRRRRQWMSMTRRLESSELRTSRPRPYSTQTHTNSSSNRTRDADSSMRRRRHTVTSIELTHRISQQVRRRRRRRRQQFDANVSQIRASDLVFHH